jgi:hypothetical protein
LSPTRSGARSATSRRSSRLSACAFVCVRESGSIPLNGPAQPTDLRMQMRDIVLVAMLSRHSVVNHQFLNIFLKCGMQQHFYSDGALDSRDRQPVLSVSGGGSVFCILALLSHSSITSCAAISFSLSPSRIVSSISGRRSGK